MPKIQTSSVSSDLFNLDGLDYGRGQYQIVYNNVQAENKTVDETTIEIGLFSRFDQRHLVQPTPINTWTNSSDVTYTTLSGLIGDLVTIVGFNTAPGGSGAGFLVPDSATIPFADDAARDAWAAANLSDLVKDLTVIEVTGSPDNIWYLWRGESDPSSYDNSKWIDVTPLIRGPQGTSGADGRTVLNGSGAPGAGLGLDGDFYIDTDANEFYGPKDAGSWGSGTELTGGLTPTQSAALQNSLQEATAGSSNNTITFTREDGTSFNVTLVSANRGTVPDPAGGVFIDLRPSGEDWDASLGSFPSGASAGYMYIVSTGGTVDGIQFSQHDLLLALASSPSISTYANNWQKIEGGVHSWGGLVGVISDQNIIDKLTRLGFRVNTTYAAPSVHNFSIDIPSRVDLNTDLNVSHTLTYSITNRQNIQSFELIVTSGDNKTLTVPTIDGEQGQDVVLSSIVTSSDTTVQFQLRITDTQNNTHDSNVVSIDVRNLTTNEFAYYGVRASDDFASVDVSTLTSVDVTNSGTQYTIDVQGANGTLLGILSPENRDPNSILDPLGQESISGFTATTNVRTINGVQYNLLTLANNSGFTGTFNYAVTTE